MHVNKDDLTESSVLIVNYGTSAYRSAAIFSWFVSVFIVLNCFSATWFLFSRALSKEDDIKHLVLGFQTCPRQKERNKNECNEY